MKTTMDRSELCKLAKQGISGVYLLYQDRQVVYIGRSINVYNRVYWHLTQKRPFDSYMVIPSNYRLSCAIEAVLIALLEPVYNASIDMAHGTNARIKSETELSW